MSIYRVILTQIGHRSTKIIDYAIQICEYMKYNDICEYAIYEI